MFQSSLVEVAAAVPVRRLTVAVTLVLVGVAVRRLVGARLAGTLRRRLLLGVPWGTLLTIGGVLAVYLFLQGAYWHDRPLVTPFRTWSYGYPLGMLTAAFTHASDNHVVGNLLATLVYGTVVEYVWGHYPTERGTSTFGSWRRNPFVRPLAIPVGAVAVGLFGNLFALGPVIGFSGVVYALAGFALVTRPVLFLGGLLASRVLTLLFNTALSPEPTLGGSVQFVTPWWAGVAIQGHAVGLLTGVCLGAALRYYRGTGPAVERVFFATLVFAVSNGLWAVYVPLGGGQYTLYRWLGTVLVALLALLVAATLRVTDARLLPNFDGGWPSAAAFALLVGFGALCLAGVPTGLATVDAADAPEGGVEVRGYVVTYGEDVENGYVEGIPVVNRLNRSVTESGVVVANPTRDVWITAVPADRLALRGTVPVVVGGVGWRETVTVNRTDWAVPGNDSVYRVTVARDDAEPRTVYTSPPSTAAHTIAGRTVTLRPVDDGFHVAVERADRPVAVGPLPANRTSERIGGLTLQRNRSTLYASYNDTRVSVAERR